MTNREKMIQTNEYDFLIRIQNNLENTVPILRDYCILDLITGRNIKCELPCKKCIQKWLNERENWEA